MQRGSSCCHISEAKQQLHKAWGLLSIEAFNSIYMHSVSSISSTCLLITSISKAVYSFLLIVLPRPGEIKNVRRKILNNIGHLSSFSMSIYFFLLKDNIQVERYME